MKCGAGCMTASIIQPVFPMLPRGVLREDSWLIESSSHPAACALIHVPSVNRPLAAPPQEITRISSQVLILEP